MKTTNYKVGDVIELEDGVQYVYRGKTGKKGTMCMIRYCRTGYQRFGRSRKKSV